MPASSTLAGPGPAPALRSRWGRILRWLAWPTVALWVLAIVVLHPLAGSLYVITDHTAAANLPAAAPSTRVAVLQEAAQPTSDAGGQRTTDTVAVLFVRAGGLISTDLPVVAGARTAVAGLAGIDGLGAPSAVRPAPDGQAAAFTAEVRSSALHTARTDTDAVQRVRSAVGASTRGARGLQVFVTGPAAVTADGGSTSQTTLLLTAMLIVAMILLVVYRSVLLWDLPAGRRGRGHCRRPGCDPRARQRRTHRQHAVHVDLDRAVLRGRQRLRPAAHPSVSRRTAAPRSGGRSHGGGLAPHAAHAGRIRRHGGRRHAVPAGGPIRLAARARPDRGHCGPGRPRGPGQLLAGDADHCRPVRLLAPTATFRRHHPRGIADLVTHRRRGRPAPGPDFPGRSASAGRRERGPVRLARRQRPARQSQTPARKRRRRRPLRRPLRTRGHRPAGAAGATRTSENSGADGTGGPGRRRRQPRAAVGQYTSYSIVLSVDSYSSAGTAAIGGLRDELDRTARARCSAVVRPLRSTPPAPPSGTLWCSSRWCWW